MTNGPKIIIDLVRQFEEEIILGSRNKYELAHMKFRKVPKKLFKDYKIVS